MRDGRPGAGSLEGDLHQIEPVLLGFAYRATGDRELSRDLVQEALLAAVAAPVPFEGRSKLRTWIVGILSHKIADHFRRRATEALDAEGTAELLRAPSEEDLERAAIARQTLGRVEAALRELPDRERLAILLVDVEQLGRPESCDALGVDANHLRVLLHRGRHRLRRLLEHG